MANDDSKQTDSDTVEPESTEPAEPASDEGNTEEPGSGDGSADAADADDGGGSEHSGAGDAEPEDVAAAASDDAGPAASGNAGPAASGNAGPAASGNAGPAASGDAGPAASGDAAAPKKASAASSAGKRPRRGAAARKSGFSTRNVIGFGILVAVLLVAFGMLGTRGGGDGGTPQPRWKIGQVVDVEITVVSPDFRNLSCAMEPEIAGKHCGFAAANKRHEKASGTARDDASLLQPYTTTDRTQFMAAGVWTQPALKEKLDKEDFERPGPRFAVACKYTVEGKTAAAQVQWKSGDAWHSGAGWYTGTVSECKIAK
ncbi:MAG: hypothetical protein EXR75_15995 [Myxococcales bacterium]|nr:hypothetical protein [Myxococcales bacterium]